MLTPIWMRGRTGIIPQTSNRESPEESLKFVLAVSGSGTFDTGINGGYQRLRQAGWCCFHLKAVGYAGPPVYGRYTAAEAMEL